jgi:superfamily I DNA/RNA helicase
VLTFSRRAAGELRERITSRLGRTSRQPVARTFHSYAFGLLRSEAALRGEEPPRLLSGPEQDVVVRELLRGDVDSGAESWPERLRPALLTRGFAQELRDLLHRAVERGLSPADLVALGRQHRRDDWVAAGRFARQYEQVSVLRESASYDPAELIRAATSLLRSDAAILARVRDEHRFIVVDEYQDTDPAQDDLLQLVCGSRDLIAVGDPDQSIYGFRGADPAAIRRFPDRYRASDGTPARPGRPHRSAGPKYTCWVPRSPRRPTLRTGSGRRTSSTVSPGLGWRCSFARPTRCRHFAAACLPRAFR